MGKIKNLRIVTMLKPMNMYKKLIISVLLLEIVIFSAIVLLCKKFIIPKEVESALITQVGVLLTFIGSLASIGLTLDSNIKQKRAENVLNTKLKYYHQFCEAYVKKCSYIKYPMTLEAIESNMEFVKEVNRLPLYSSQKIILLIEKNKDRYINQISNSEVEEIQKLNKEYENLKNYLSNDENIDLKEKIKKIESKIQDKMKNIIGEDKEDNSFGELYRLIREDLNNDSFEQFTGELKSTLTIPNIVPIKTKQ